MMVAEQELLTVREAARRFNVTVWTVHNWIRRGKIGAYSAQIGNGLYVDANEIEEKRTPQKRV
jgi:excisionase family DNA binding protein